MQKQTKLLESNILKSQFYYSQNFFNIENCSKTSVIIKSSKYASRTLTKNFSKQVNFLNILNISKLKYPLIINFFKKEAYLQEYMKELVNTKNNVVITKINNNIFRSFDFSLIKTNNSYSIFSQFKNLIFNLSRVLKRMKK
jgi:hypothetical protein